MENDIQYALLKNDNQNSQNQNIRFSFPQKNTEDSLKMRTCQSFPCMKVQNINQMMDEDEILIKYPQNKSRLIQSFKNKNKSNNKQTIYDPYKNPVDIQLAINHGKANRVCKQTETNKFQERCPCCDLPIQNEQYDLNCNPNDFQHLGACFPLYFLFIKQSIVLLTIQFFISSLPAIIMNFSGDNCATKSFVCKSSFLNVKEQSKDKFSEYQAFLNLLNIIILLIVMEIFKIQQNNYKNKFEKGRVSASNFSIMITSSITNVMSVEDIENFFEKRIPNSKQDIAQIFLLYDLSLYNKLHQKYLDKIKQKIKNNLDIDKLNKNIDLDHKIMKFQQNQKQLVLEILNIEQQKNNYYLKLQNKTKIKSPSMIYIKDQESFIQSEEEIKFAGVIIVVFSHQQTQKKVAKFFKKSYFQSFICYFSCFFTQKFKNRILDKFIVKKQLINVEKCEEPSDILWTNITSEKKTSKNIYISNAICYGCMIVALIIIVKIKRQVNLAQISIPKQSDIGQFGQTIISILLSLSISSIIALANVLIGIVIRYFAAKEKNVTQTQFFIRVANKLTNMFAINMILTTLFASIIIKNEDLDPSINTKQQFLLNLDNQYFFLFITGSYVAIIFSVFDIVWGFKLFKRYKINKKHPKNEETQMEVNNTFEGHPVDMGLRYANVLKNLQFTLAVSPLLPFGVFMCIIGLSGLYWADKYLLLRRFVCKNYLTHKLAIKMIDKMHISILYFSIGNFIIQLVPIYDTQPEKRFYEKLKNLEFYISLLGVLFAFLIHFFPIKNINFAKLYSIIKKKIHEKQNISESYQDLKHILVEEYAQFHPIYKNNLENKKQDHRKISYLNLQNSQILDNQFEEKQIEQIQQKQSIKSEEKLVELTKSMKSEEKVELTKSQLIQSVNYMESRYDTEFNSYEEFDRCIQNIRKHTKQQL